MLLDRPNASIPPIAFTNEEGISGQSGRMGSAVAARASRESGERVEGTLSIETVRGAEQRIAFVIRERLIAAELLEAPRSL